jgi:hypothetical protein
LNPEALIAAALRSEPVPWPSDVSPGFEARVVDSAVDHGAAALLSVTPALRDWPATVQAAVRQHRREAAATEIIRQHAHTALVDALSESRVKTLILKGSALAYTHYRHPWLRPRLDIDVYLAPDDRPRACQVLRDLGYAPANHFGGELVTFQTQFRRTNRHGWIDRVDLHWKLANPQVFAHAFSFDELYGDARPLPQLGRAATTLSPVHALILACVHRVAHHANSDRLIWLYDIRLLVETMSAAELERAAAEALTKRLQPVVAAGVRRALEIVGSESHTPEIEQLLKTGDDAAALGSEFLSTNRAKVDDLLSDLKALPGWPSKLRLIREHLLPPAAYMRKTYGFSSPLLLPFVYALRAIAGAGKWLRADH